MNTFTLERIRALQFSNRIVMNGSVEEDIYYELSNDNTIHFGNVEFIGNVVFEGFENNQQVKFEDCTFKKIVKVTGANLRELKFNNCKFEYGFFVDDSNIDHFRMVNCFARTGINVTDLQSSELSISGVKTDSARIHFGTSNIRNCSLSGLQDSTDVIFTGFDSVKNGYRECKIDSFFVFADAQFKGLLLVAGIEIGLLGLSEDNISARLSFKDLKVHSVKLEHFTNRGVLSFSNIQPQSRARFRCSNSNLGKCEIYDVNFGAFHRITIENASIQDIIPTNVTWCSDEITHFLGRQGSKNDREVYRQLKNVMIRQNDKVQELLYHKAEMNAVLFQLKEEGSNWSDRFILWSNKVSNAHGHSWNRAIVILLGMTLVAYVTNKMLLGYTQFDSRTIVKHIGLFLESMNPVRKFSAVYDETKKGVAADIAYTIDVLYRVLASYLIFQFISAFRKYVKK